MNPLSAIDWNDLKYFLAVARAGTIRGGGAIIQANHATVSRRITALETMVHSRLFDRSKGGLVLTQSGEELLPFAVQIEEQIAAASRVITGRDVSPSGAIYVSIPPFLSLSSIIEDIAEFGVTHEAIEIRLHISNSFVSLERREADITLRYVTEVVEDVVGRKLAACTSAAYCTPSYASRIKNNGGEGLHMVGWDEQEGAKSAPWLKNTDYPKAQLRHRVMEGVPQVELAAAGAGLTYIPCFIGDRDARLVRAPFQSPRPDRNLWLLLHGDLRKTARIRLFVDFIAEKVSRRRAEFEVTEFGSPAGDDTAP